MAYEGAVGSRPAGKMGAEEESMKALLAAACAMFVGLSSQPAMAGADAARIEKEKLAQAHELIGGYYGNSSDLQKAATLVSEVLRGNPKSAPGWMEAARITIKGGHVVSEEFVPGTLDSYRSLVNKSLELDPDNADALALRAETYLLSGAYDDALATIVRGQKIDPDNPWLKLQLASYHKKTRNAKLALDALYSVITPRCDTDTDYRRACVISLLQQIYYFSLPDNADLVRSLAKRMLVFRDPRDAWSLGDLGLYVAETGLDDEGIEYERQALKVMNYGVARLTLASLLYGKAAVLREEGKPYKPLLAEADALGISEESVLNWYTRVRGPVQKRTSAIIRLFESRTIEESAPAAKPAMPRRSA